MACARFSVCAQANDRSPSCRSAHDWHDPVTQTTARAAIALHGERLNEGNGTTAMLESRNACRRVIATLRDKAVNASQRNDAKAADAFIDQMEAVSAMSLRVQTLLDCELENDAGGPAAGSDVWTMPDGKRVKVLRSASDIANHYEARRGPDIDIGDLFRGIAGMKTRGDVKAALSEGPTAPATPCRRW